MRRECFTSLRSRRSATTFTRIWSEPLTAIRALLKDDHGHEVNIRAEVRTGDTPAAKRQSIIKRPPHILVTTPESFYLLLTSESGRKLLAPVRTVIVDEIHAVVGNRRGSHLALSIERLAALAKTAPAAHRLSATQKPIEEVARFLIGTNGSTVRDRRLRLSARVGCGHRVARLAPRSRDVERSVGGSLRPIG